MFSVWGFLVPDLRGVDLKYSFREALPFLGLFLIFPLSDAIKARGACYYLDFCNKCLTIVGFLVISVWIMATYFNLQYYAYGLKIAYQVVSTEDSKFYIGPIHDGSFRVMWITTMLFPFFLVYKSLKKFKMGWTLFYLIAIYATGTRAFLYVSLLSISLLLLRHNKLAFFLSVSGLILTAPLWLALTDGVRVFTIAGDLGPESVRYQQFVSLAKLFLDFPFIGAGFGASVDVSAGEVGAYSYELTYLALLAKLGLVGFFGLVIFGLVIITLAFKTYPGRKMEVFMISCSFILITATNPYLINFVGMTLLSFLIALAFWRQKKRNTPSSWYGTPNSLA
jgi:hypothetical protein